MKIDISEETYTLIAAVEPDVSAFVERAARQQLSKSGEHRTKAAQRRGEELVEKFRKYRGMLKGVSVDEIVKSRHEGLL